MKFIIILALLLCQSAFAKFDLKYGFQGRSYPAIGGGAIAEGGYNYTLWGTAGKNPMYGLIRPYARINTSAVVNTVETAIEFYPISILGLVVGKEYNQSSIDLPFFDCEAITCQGSSDTNFYKIRGALGFGGLILVGEMRKEKTEFSETDKPFGDFFHVMVADGQGDEFIEKKLILGFDTASFLIALIHEWGRFEESEQEKKQNLIAFRKYTPEGFWTVGVGKFQAGDETVGDSQAEPGTIFVFQWVWEPSKSLKLF
jgi:hypothetical protein